MFNYQKMKEELEQIECPQHKKTAIVVFNDGHVHFESVCCEEHQKKLEKSLPEIEERNLLQDILEDVY